MRTHAHTHARAYTQACHPPRPHPRHSPPQPLHCLTPLWRTSACAGLLAVPQPMLQACLGATGNCMCRVTKSSSERTGEPGDEPLLAVPLVAVRLPSSRSDVWDFGRRTWQNGPQGQGHQAGGRRRPNWEPLACGVLSDVSDRWCRLVQNGVSRPRQQAVWAGQQFTGRPDCRSLSAGSGGLTD